MTGPWSSTDLASGATYSRDTPRLHRLVGFRGGVAESDVLTVIGGKRRTALDEGAGTWSELSCRLFTVFLQTWLSRLGKQFQFGSNSQRYLLSFLSTQEGLNGIFHCSPEWRDGWTSGSPRQEGDVSNLPAQIVRQNTKMFKGNLWFYIFKSMFSTAGTNCWHHHILQHHIRAAPVLRLRTAQPALMLSDAKCSVLSSRTDTKHRLLDALRPIWPQHFQYLSSKVYGHSWWEVASVRR